MSSCLSSSWAHRLRQRNPATFRRVTPGKSGSRPTLAWTSGFRRSHRVRESAADRSAERLVGSGPPLRPVDRPDAQGPRRCERRRHPPRVYRCGVRRDGSCRHDIQRGQELSLDILGLTIDRDMIRTFRTPCVSTSPTAGTIRNTTLGSRGSITPGKRASGKGHSSASRTIFLAPKNSDWRDADRAGFRNPARSMSTTTFASTGSHCRYFVSGSGRCRTC